MPTNPYSLTHVSSSGMQVFGSTPGLCGSMAAPMKWSGKSCRDPIAELVADRGPLRGDREVADVMGHEAGARAEDGQIAAPLPHQPELVALDRLAQFVVADLQLGGPRPHEGSRMPAIWRLRQSSSAFGAVV